MDSKPPESDAPPPALVNLENFFGLSKPADRLVEAVIRGVGELAYPWITRRRARADIDAMKSWNAALAQEGLPASAAELSLEQRTILRITAEGKRHQRNREFIAAEAIADFAGLATTGMQESEGCDPDWLDWFWQIAQRVSRPDMQTVWGRVLARQVSGTASYSARCLDLLRTINSDEAHSLERLAAFVWHADTAQRNNDAGIITHLELRQNDKAKLEGNLRNIIGPLHEEIFGPIGVFKESGFTYSLLFPQSYERINFRIADANFTILRDVSEKYRDKHHFSLGSGIGITPVGVELISLIDARADHNHLEIMKTALEEGGLNVQISSDSSA